MPVLLLFTYEDADSPATWSNVPYCLKRAFEQKGWLVRKVNITPCRIYGILYRRLIRKLPKYRKASRFYSTERTPLFLSYTQLKMKSILRRHSDANLAISLCFDFSISGAGIPSVILSDWTYRMLLEREHCAVEENSVDAMFMERQREVISGSSCVVTLFRKCLQRMRDDYPSANINHLGSNVVNILDEAPIRPGEILDLKAGSRAVLFIGDRKYINGAEVLIQAFRYLPDDVELHIIGLDSEDVPTHGGRVYFHGYLNKGDAHQRQEYYNLLRQAKLIVNPSQAWGGYSSIVEAMYYYTPVIVSPFDDFVADFGLDIPFGKYLSSSDAKSVSSAISQILMLDRERYTDFCAAAHNSVSDFTWASYVEKLISVAR